MHLQPPKLLASTAMPPLCNPTFAFYFGVRVHHGMIEMRPEALNKVQSFNILKNVCSRYMLDANTSNSEGV
jgi:hypothetical protein